MGRNPWLKYGFVIGTCEVHSPAQIWLGQAVALFISNMGLIKGMLLGYPTGLGH